MRILRVRSFSIFRVIARIARYSRYLFNDTARVFGTRGRAAAYESRLGGLIFFANVRLVHVFRKLAETTGMTSARLLGEGRIEVHLFGWLPRNLSWAHVSGSWTLVLVRIGRKVIQRRARREKSAHGLRFCFEREL